MFGNLLIGIAVEVIISEDSTIPLSLLAVDIFAYTGIKSITIAYHFFLRLRFDDVPDFFLRYVRVVTRVYLALDAIINHPTSII